jgi:isopenicillin N synthase-like dioxygenase
MTSGPSIPSIDLDDLSSDSAERLDRAARAIGFGYGELGLVAMSGHGMNKAEVDAYYDAFLEFTGRSDAEKGLLNRPDIWYQRGWTPPNTEQAVVAGGRPDFKECYFAAPLPLDPVARAYYPELYADNLWPERAETFQRLHMSLGAQLHEIGRRLLTGCERALGLDVGTFDALTEGAAHVTRSLRYLPTTQEHVDQEILWGEEHTDFNLLTILAGGRFYDPTGAPCPRPDQRGGLYLRTRPSASHPRGHLISGTPPDGQIVSQVGQQLEILTGGLFLATPHVIKAPTKAGYSRTSMAHFVHVHALQQLAPLAPLRTPEAIAAYRPPVLAGTYAIKTLVDISLAPKSSLDKLGYRHYDRLAQIRAEGEW